MLEEFEVMVSAHSLEMFRSRVDGALGNLVQWKMSLFIAGGLELDDLNVSLKILKNILLFSDG